MICRCGHSKGLHVEAKQNPVCTGTVKVCGRSLPCRCERFVEEEGRCTECRGPLGVCSVAGVCESCAYELWGD